MTTDLQQAPVRAPDPAATAEKAAAGAGRLTLAVIFAIAAMFLFIEIAHQILDGATRAMDTAAVSFFQRHQLPVAHELMLGVSWIGSYGLVIVIGIALAVLFRQRRFPNDAIVLLLACPGGLLLVTGLKYLFHRPRPTVVFAGHVAYHGYSFPSGHSFCAVVVFGLLAYWLTHEAPPWRRRGLWIACVSFILLMGFSRVFLGAHYPSDVIAGFAVGYPWLWGCLAFSRVLKSRSSTSRPKP